jgi:uncharacterized coiled-coil DUF342 family protein
MTNEKVVDNHDNRDEQLNQKLSEIKDLNNRLIIMTEKYDCEILGSNNEILHLKNENTDYLEKTKVFITDIEGMKKLIDESKNELSQIKDENKILNESVLCYTINIKDKEMQIDKLLSDINYGTSRYEHVSTHLFVFTHINLHLHLILNICI